MKKCINCEDKGGLREDWDGICPDCGKRIDRKKDKKEVEE